MSVHACIHVKNSPQLCRAGTGRRRGFQWYHWGYKWWRCGPNLPASPGLSVWSSGTPPTPRSVTACISQRMTHLSRLLVFQPVYYIICIFTHTANICTFFFSIKLPWPVCLLVLKSRPEGFPTCLVLALSISINVSEQLTSVGASFRNISLSLNPEGCWQWNHT